VLDEHVLLGGVFLWYRATSPSAFYLSSFSPSFSSLAQSTSKFQELFGDLTPEGSAEMEHAFFEDELIQFGMPCD